MADLKKYIRGNIKLEDVRTFNQNGTDTIESLEVLGIDRFNKVWGIPFESIGGGNPSGGTGGTGGTVVETTYDDLINTLIPNEELIPGTFYRILDADKPLYGGTEITLTAISSNELSLQGSGKFYCPKYDVSAERTGYGIWTKQMEGTFYSIVGTFVQNEVVTANNGATATYLAQGFLEWISGDWSGATSITGYWSGATANISGVTTPSYSIGQVVHWGGKSWTNVNGNIGASIDKYTLNSEWTEIPFNSTDYNVYIDEIHYDFDNDMIIYRKDRYNNVVSGSNQVFVEFTASYGNPIKDFQWGCMKDDFNTNVYFRLGIQGNEIIDSSFETLNTRGKYIWFNKLSQFSYIRSNTLSSNSSISNNTLSSSSGIRKNTLSNSNIQNNTLSHSYILQHTLSSNNIQNNTLSSSYIQYNNLSSGSNIESNTLSSNSSIQYNTLSSSSIFKNTLSSNSNINSNILSNYSSINSNTLSSNSGITNNTLSSGTFYSNTLSNSSIFTFGNAVAVVRCNANAFNTSNSTIDLLGATIIGSGYSKELFNRQDGTPRLSYVDDSDVIVITNVNT